MKAIQNAKSQAEADKLSKELSELLSKNIKIAKAGELTEDADSSNLATFSADLPTMARLAQVDSLMIGIRMVLDSVTVMTPSVTTVRDVKANESFTINITAKDIYKTHQGVQAGDVVGNLRQGYEIREIDVTGDGKPETVLNRRDVVWTNPKGFEDVKTQQILTLGNALDSKEVVLKTSKDSFKYFDMVLLGGKRYYLFSIPRQGVAGMELNPDNLRVILIPEDTITKVMGLIAANYQIKANAEGENRKGLTKEELAKIQTNNNAIAALLVKEAVATPAGKISHCGEIPLRGGPKEREAHRELMAALVREKNNAEIVAIMTTTALSKIK